MTERRLKEIFIEAVFPTVGVTDETLLWFETRDLREDYIEAMKQAVNEALEEAADSAKVEATKGARVEIERAVYPHHDGWEVTVNKQSVLKLKVK